MVALTAEWLRLLVGVLLAGVLGSWTLRRLSGDMADPSIDIGRDYFLLRGSGMVAVAFVAGLAALAWLPWMNEWLFVAFAGVLGYWSLSELWEAW